MEGINFPSEKDDCKKIEKKIALNVLYAEKEKIYPVYMSKHNSNCEKQVILLMISNGEKQCHYLPVYKLSALLRGITTKNNGAFCCLNCIHSFRTLNILASHFCNVIMPSEDTKLVKFNQYQKSNKTPFFFKQILSVLQKRLMDVKIILKIHIKQKSAKVFHQVFQCL